MNRRLEKEETGNWITDNTGKFSGRAAIYEKYRPSYPDEFIDYLYTEAGFTENSVVADIGAGTGILSRLLAGRGSRVILAEPNADMLALAKEKLGNLSNCEFVRASAENTGLKDNSVDFVTVAQAFHWFDLEQFRAECKRILRPGGKVVLVWNDRHNSGEIDEETFRANVKYCPEFKGFAGGLKHEPETYADFFEGGCDFRSFANIKGLTEDDFINGHLSASYAPEAGTEDFDGYVGALRDIFHGHERDGIVINRMITKSFSGRV
ncbi:MAG: class I SAM-dependent methyltransferase [Defluviitaleaceae bacterium]|nr:class I SAM-dependent methyltransferase [Defluviitaleaceae bacterium]